MASHFDAMRIAIQVFTILDLSLSIVIFILLLLGCVHASSLDGTSRESRGAGSSNMGTLVTILLILNMVVDALGIAGAFLTHFALIISFAVLKLFCLGIVGLAIGWLIVLTSIAAIYLSLVWAGMMKCR